MAGCGGSGLGAWPVTKKTKVPAVLDFSNPKVVAKLLDDAADHLDFCGFGDAWERECAKDDGLMNRIVQWQAFRASERGR